MEDDEKLRALARRMLMQNGYRILEAPHGKEALKVAKQHIGPINLLVTDVVMPQMNGRELTERLLPYQPQIKVLYLSGYTDDTVIRLGILEEETSFLQKPFTPGALKQKVREVLASSSRK